MSQHELAAAFRALHTGANDPLVLPNAWDAMSARLVESTGARAIATTSAGVSWALGFPDGHGVTREMMLESVRRMVSAVKLPVTADVEGGYGDGTTDDIAATVRGVIGAGAVGVNFEDSPGRNGEPMLSIADGSERLRAARAAADAAGVALFINARIDTYLRKAGSTDSERFDLTVERARAFVAAGADGVFVPLANDAETIGRLVRSVGAPLNVIGSTATPTIPELGALGVARVSVGPGLARAVMAHIRRASVELHGPGTYEEIRDQLTSPEANGLFVR